LRRRANSENRADTVSMTKTRFECRAAQTCQYCLHRQNQGRRGTPDDRGYFSRSRASAFIYRPSECPRQNPKRPKYRNPTAPRPPVGVSAQELQ